jgi:hypothetical protein
MEKAFVRMLSFAIDRNCICFHCITIGSGEIDFFINLVIFSLFWVCGGRPVGVPGPFCDIFFTIPLRIYTKHGVLE